VKEAEQLIRKGIEELGIHYTETHVKAFTVYLQELKKWNRAYNLTGLRKDREIIIKHFLDSLLFSKVLPVNAQTVADIGSGAGFPGIPVNIMNPHLKVFLIEPTKKKTMFLRHICKKLDLYNIEIIDKRIEDISGLKVDVVITRALFSVRDFMNKTKEVLNDNGVSILSKGPNLEEELKQIELKNISRKDFILPFLNIVRHMVIVKK
jgi:16S rRNA (guanine527-N7)-methyltransferase